MKNILIDYAFVYRLYFEIKLNDLLTTTFENIRSKETYL